MAFVAIQRHPDREEGYGGPLTKHYVSVYISLADEAECMREPRYCVARVVKVKYPPESLGRNPYGMVLHYKVFEKGSRIELLEDWHPGRVNYPRGSNETGCLVCPGLFR